VEQNGATTSRWWTTPWIVYTLAGGILFVLYIIHDVPFPPTDSLALVGLSTTLATAFGIIKYHPKPTWTWILLQLALILFLVGGYLNFADHTMGNLTSSRPILPDLLSISAYLILAIGFLGLTHPGRRKSRLDTLDAFLDGMLVGLAVTILVFTTLIGPRLSAIDAPLRTQIIISTYPGLSALVLIILFRLALTTGSRATLPYISLVLSFSLMLVGDFLYMLSDARIKTFPPTTLDAPYFIAYLFAGACVLNPDMAKISMPRYTDTAVYRIIQGIFITVALSVPAATLVQSRSGTNTSQLATLVLLFTLALVVSLRILRALYTANASQDRLSHLALHDPLTGLPNRHFLSEHLEISENTALIFIDLDQFKLINDTFGHPHGDALLIEVAARLSKAVRKFDTVARLSGDEFLVIIPEVDSMHQAREIADDLRRRLRQPFQGADGPLFITGSFGIALSDSTSPLDLETLLIYSDTAMYEAKRSGRDTVVSFTQEMRVHTIERLALKNDLRIAIEDDNIYCAYQPVVDAQTGELKGMEALARWTHPSLGARSPEDFIQLAEDTGNILALGTNVLHRALKDFSDLYRKGLMPATSYVAVNFSPIQLDSPDLSSLIEHQLEEFNLDPSNLCVEITETVAMNQPITERDALDKLRSIGVRLAIDDFGTGYSSLAYLSRLPIDIIKIDKTFVSANPHSRPILTAIIAMAQSLGIATTAEGVETDEQRVLLAGLGVDSLQGYLISRPVAIDKLGALLRSPTQSLAPRWSSQDPNESLRQVLSRRSP